LRVILATKTSDVVEIYMVACLPVFQSGGPLLLS
jgi:hypothetical protein